MSLKRDSKEVEVNNKVIELFFDYGQFIVTMYDNDRLKYTESLEFTDHEEALNNFLRLIDIEQEKMSHQF